MSDYNAIVNVGMTLIDLLWNNFDADIKNIISRDQITLSSPEDMADGERLSLFMYQTTEETFQRNQPTRSTWLKNGSQETLGTPLYLNLFYMITPNTKKGENDQILLGKVAQIFNENSMLRAPQLHKSLANDGQDMRLIFNPLSLDDINKIWTVVSKSKPYRSSLYYQITPVRIDSARTQSVRRVIEREISYSSENV